MKTRTQSKNLSGNRLYAVCFFLMLITLTGYAVNIVMNVKYHGSTNEDIIISTIFFIGAAFAFLLVHVSYKIFLAASENEQKTICENRLNQMVSHITKKSTIPSCSPGSPGSPGYLASNALTAPTALYVMSGSGDKTENSGIHSQNFCMRDPVSDFYDMAFVDAMAPDFNLLTMYRPVFETEKTYEAPQKNHAEHFYQGMRLLVAEDKEANRGILQAMLDGLGVEIDFAENGYEAYDKFISAPSAYDMIFMDINMPETNGYEAANMIRSIKDSRAEKIPIIGMTSDIFYEDIEKCFQAGMNDHIGKPFIVEEIMEKLTKYYKKDIGKNIINRINSQTQ